MLSIEATQDPARKAFLPISEVSPFPIQNLPWGVFRPKGTASQGLNTQSRCGVAIGDYVLDLSVLAEHHLLPSTVPSQVFHRGTLNAFAALGLEAWRSVRCRVSELLDRDCEILRDNSALREKALWRQDAVQMELPMEIGDYTDFYASREHATNVGTMFRGAEQALNPNWLHLPIGYHGRASSVVVSGTNVRRPLGQSVPAGAAQPVFGPSKAMDFELEVGFFIGPGNQLGHPISLKDAENHIFGLVLLNDWSARDIQRWEYVPLGPFLGKNFCTSISPWVVSLDALAPFRCQGPSQDPTPLPYLQPIGPASFDVQLHVSLQSEKASHPEVISRSNFRYLYWSMAQQLTHHASNGCNLRPGDLLASGTISGPTPDSYGSMLELAWNRERPIALANGETRVMLLDGDRLTLSGYAQGKGYRIGFGEVTGVIEPSLPFA